MIILVGWINVFLLIDCIFNILVNGVLICRLLSWVWVMFNCVFNFFICVCCLFKSCFDVVFDCFKFLICVYWCLVLLIFVFNFVICVYFFWLLSWINILLVLIFLLLLKYIVCIVLVICVVMVIDLFVVVVFNVLIVIGMVCMLVIVVFIGVVCELFCLFDLLVGKLR